MGFESGSGDDPFAEDDEAEEQSAEDQSESTETTTTDEVAAESTTGSAAGSTAVVEEPAEEPSSSAEPQGSGADETPDAGIKPLSPSGDLSPGEVARRLAPPEYHEQGHQVPVTTWRDGVSTGRERKMFEVQEQLVGRGGLEEQALEIVQDELDAEIKKTDLREFALAWAYANPDILVQMAMEWGLQYD